jgi:hypothetical protein
MLTDFERDDLPNILARAHRRAWELYQALGSSTLSEEVARPSLAKHLVALAKEGVTRERALAAAGLRHLISLATSQPSTKPAPSMDDGEAFECARRQLLHFRIDDARARFLITWRVPLGAQF